MASSAVLPKGENIAAVLHAPCDLRVESVPKPRPGPGSVLLSMRSVGICGSDVHFWTHGNIGDYKVEAPMVLGHEGSGVVMELGEGVANLSVGDRVAIEPGVPCGSCRICKGGRYNLCPGVKFAATPPVNGSLAHFIVHPADYCFKLPAHVSFEDAALFEPLSVAIHACRRGKVSLGHTVLITGAGPIGLMSLLATKAAGATSVVMVDIDAKRLESAKAAGADHTVLLSREKGGSEGIGVEADVCIEASGAESAVQVCINHARRGGVVVLVGMGKSMITIPVLPAMFREVDIRGVFRYCNTYRTALDLVASGRINARFLVTHRFPLEKALDAFETAKSVDSQALKVIVDCEPKRPV